MEDDNKDIQIPAFTVLKNGSILKNIFLIRKQSSQFQESREEILLVGRHPHCHITLEHPSISRYHLRIHSNPSSHIISVVDLSSVHGTWVSGRRIEPGVHVMLKEGDTVKMGGSSRVYELHWVPLSQAYNVDQQFVPTVNTIEEGEGEEEEEEEEEKETHQDEKHEEYSSDDDLECLDLSLSNKIQDSPLKSLDPLISSVPGDSSSDIKVEISHLPITSNENDDSISIRASLASETTSATEVSDSRNNSEEPLNLLRDNMSNELELLYHKNIKEDLFSAPILNSSCDDTEVEHSSSLKTGNGNGELLTAVQAPLVDSEAISKTEILDCLNKSEDQLSWIRDNLSNDFDQISHVTIKDDIVSVNLSNAMKTHENDALDQDNENEYENQQKTNNGSVPVVLFDGVNRDVGCEFEQLVNQRDMTDEPASMVLSDDAGMTVKFESVDEEIMNKESVFELLSDVTNLDQEKTLTPDISMNPWSKQNVSASMYLSDSLDGKELEFYTPDKENKNPNACSGKSLSKRAVNSTIFGEKNIFGFSQKLFATDEGMNREHEVDPFVSCEEDLAASSEKEHKSRRVIMKGSCNSFNCPQNVPKAINSSQTLAKKRWTMVVDSNSLLGQKSLKHLKLLEGIKGTRLFVPKIVVNELMDIKSQDSFFSRSSKKASLALRWIDECVMNTRWWINVDDEIVHSQTAASEVLEIALRLHKEITDQKIIILSNNLTLKIKAMAEGIMCEAADEFHESLVNPFSERFMWVGSSARGPTWSCVDDDDDIVRHKYHRIGYKSHMFKGLKLLARVTTSQRC